MGNLLRCNKKSPLERGGTLVPGCVFGENLLIHSRKIIKSLSTQSTDYNQQFLLIEKLFLNNFLPEIC